MANKTRSLIRSFRSYGIDPGAAVETVSYILNNDSTNHAFSVDPLPRVRKMPVDAEQLEAKLSALRHDVQNTAIVDILRFVQALYRTIERDGDDDQIERFNASIGQFYEQCGIENSYDRIGLGESLRTAIQTAQPIGVPLSQKEFAERVGVDERFISDLCNGYIVDWPEQDLEQIQQQCEALFGYNFDYMAFRTDNARYMHATGTGYRINQDVINAKGFVDACRELFPKNTPEQAIFGDSASDIITRIEESIARLQALHEQDGNQGEYRWSHDVIRLITVVKNVVAQSNPETPSEERARYEQLYDALGYRPAFDVVGFKQWIEDKHEQLDMPAADVAREITQKMPDAARFRTIQSNYDRYLDGSAIVPPETEILHAYIEVCAEHNVAIALDDISQLEVLTGRWAGPQQFDQLIWAVLAERISAPDASIAFVANGEQLAANYAAATPEEIRTMDSRVAGVLQIEHDRAHDLLHANMKAFTADEVVHMAGVLGLDGALRHAFIQSGFEALSPM